MTTRERVDSAVIRRIYEAYRMDADDQIRLYEQLERQLTLVYRQTIAQQLNLYGCQKLATGPDSAATKWIQGKARKDAESIATTYDRELMSQIQQIYRANKRSNRYAYMRTLDAWIVRRNGFKTPSIALNTMTSAREYAKDRFITENGIEGKFFFSGPPPVCQKCVRIKALGPMTYKQTQLASRRLPAHVNCPHTYQQLIPKKIACDDMTFTG